MYCWNCGKQVEDHAVFCPHCGMKQVDVPQPEPKKPVKSVNIPILCAFICVAALLGILLLSMGTKQPEPEQTLPPAVETTPPKVTEALKETEAVPETQETQPPAVDPGSRELPDLAAFLETEYTQDEWGYTHYVTCLIDRDEDSAIIDQVLALLLEPRYQLKQMDRESDSEGTHYTFEYTGTNEDIDWVYLKAGGKYHVKLTTKPYGSRHTALILYTFPEFYLKDPGSRCTQTGSHSDSDDDSDNGGGSLYEDKCWYCGGDGRCNECGGSGQVYKWLPGTTDRVQVRCTNCNGGSCRQCGGDGKD